MLSVRGAGAAGGGESKMISNNSNFLTIVTFFNNCRMIFNNSNFLTIVTFFNNCRMIFNNSNY